MCVAVPDSPQRSRRAEGSAWRGRALADSQCVWVARPKGRLTSFTGMEPKGFMSTFVGTVEFVPPRVPTGGSRGVSFVFAPYTQFCAHIFLATFLSSCSLL